ncbi:MAG TPA: serine/threonine-protein kinase [Kofleriaceae bacterium]|nr:serine/threonine-protein kinase [Kofleriaceae bacterium]
MRDEDPTLRDGEPDSVDHGDEVAQAQTLASGTGRLASSSAEITGEEPTGMALGVTGVVELAPSLADVAAAVAHMDEALLPTRGESIDRFVVLEVLGRGGFGFVVAAFDPELNRRVAIKLLYPSMYRSLGPTEARSRLLREAQALAQLSHPNVVAVHEIGTVDEQVFVAMEFVEGETLAAWLRAEPRPLDDVLAVFIAAGRGLAAAHRVGIVHRDFKPDNVILGRDGRVRVLDFGLARPAGPPTARRGEARPAGVATPTLERELTRGGAIMGTPAYMAPEQHLGKDVDARGDQFSFCVALYEALYRRRPFAGSTISELADNVIRGNLLPQPDDAAVPASIRDTITRGLGTDPGVRHPSMDALLAGLESGPHLEAELKLVGRWDSAVHDRVRDAFLGAGGADAAEILRRVQELLQRYARRWVELYVEARGESVRDPHLRLAWLSQRLDELHALAEVFAGADAEVIEHAIDACRRLTSLDAVGTSATPPLPDEPDARAVVARVRLQLARARKLRDAGKYAPGEAAARAAFASAEVQRYAPVIAETLLVLGELEACNGRGTAAEATLWRAVLSSDACGYDAVRAAAMTALISLVGSELARPAEGARWATAAMAVAERLGEDRAIRGRVREGLARALVRGGGYGEALEQSLLALEDLEAALGSSHPEVADALTGAGRSHAELGQWDQAEIYLRRALDIRVEVLGSEHPRLAQALGELGLLATRRGQYDVALGFHTRAVEVAQRSLAPEHVALADHLENLGEVLFALGRHQDALAPLERALALREDGPDPNHPDIANALNNLGKVFRATGFYQEARGCYERALAAREHVLGPDHPEVASCLNNLGMALMSEGRHAEAEGCHRRALDIRERALGADHPVIANSLTNIARACRKLGRDEQAEGLLERAVAIWDRAGHPFVAHALTELGELAMQRGELDQARQSFARALEVREAKLGAQHPSLAPPLRGLAGILAERGDHAAACTTFARAVAVLEAAYGATHEDLAPVLFGWAQASTDSTEARALAIRARNIYADAGPRAAPDRAAVEAWLGAWTE